MLDFFFGKKRLIKTLSIMRPGMQIFMNIMLLITIVIIFRFLMFYSKYERKKT